MTKRLASIVLAASAASVVALPAAPASACGTFIRQCIEEVVDSAVAPVCVTTFQVCVPPTGA